MIAGQIGHRLSPFKAVVNTKQEYGDVPAYSFAYDSGGAPATT